MNKEKRLYNYLMNKNKKNIISLYLQKRFECYIANKNIAEVEKKLVNEQNEHDLCIKDFNQECENLKKQVQFESKARERAIAKIKELQKELAEIKKQERKLIVKENGETLLCGDCYCVNYDVQDIVKENIKLKQNQTQLAIQELEEVNGILTDTIIQVTQDEMDLNKLCYLEEISSKFNEKMQDEIKKLRVKNEI